MNGADIIHALFGEQIASDLQTTQCVVEYIPFMWIAQTQRVGA